MALRDLLPAWARRTGDPTPPPPALARALADLDRLAAARPELADAAGPLAAVLRAAFGRPVRPAELHADPGVIIAGWGAGVPAFFAGDEPPALDHDSLSARATAVCAAVSARQPQAGRLAPLIASTSIDLRKIWRDALSGREGAVEEPATGAGIDPAFLRSVLRLAVLPALAAHSERLAAIRPGEVWKGLGCPNCGGPPSLSESRGLEQRRHLRCGVCAADWPGDRLRCPFCEENDHRRLSYRYVEGEQDRHRLACCDSCRGRIKVVPTLSPITAPGLLVAELATSHLDGVEVSQVGRPRPC